MLPRKNRLSARQPFHSAMSFHNELFTLKAKKGSLVESRFAFVVGKRIDKRAVVRNESKRVIRSCVEALLPQISPGYDMLFILKKRLKRDEKENACEKVADTFIRGRMLKKL